MMYDRLESYTHVLHVEAMDRAAATTRSHQRCDLFMPPQIVTQAPPAAIHSIPQLTRRNGLRYPLRKTRLANVVATHD